MHRHTRKYLSHGVQNKSIAIKARAREPGQHPHSYPYDGALERIKRRKLKSPWNDTKASRLWAIAAFGNLQERGQAHKSLRKEINNLNRNIRNDKHKRKETNDLYTAY